MKRILLVLPLAFAMMACDSSDSTSQGVIVRVAQMLQKDKVKKLNELLLNEARTELSTAEARAELKAELSPLDQLSFGKVTLLKEEKPTKFDDLTLQTVEVLKNKEMILTVTVKCLNHYGMGGSAPKDGDLSVWRDGDGLPIHEHEPIEHDGPDWYNTCRVSEIVKQ